MFQPCSIAQTSCFFSILAFIRPISCECIAILSELSIDAPQQSEAEFVELVKVGCAPAEQPPIAHYLLLIVKENDAHLRGPVIVFSSTFENFAYPINTDFFVIGSQSEFINPDVPFTSDAVRYRNKHGTKMQSDFDLPSATGLHDVILNGNKYPCAVLLLRQALGREQGINKLILPIVASSRRHRPMINAVLVTDAMERIIVSNLVDMYIYSRRSFINSCQFFRRLCELTSGKMDYNIGSEFDVEDHLDVSVNRCPATADKPLFLAHTLFKIGRRTPHEMNDCTGFHFHLAESIDEIVRETGATVVEITNEDTTPSQCTINRSSFQLQHISSEVIADYRDCRLQLSTVTSGDLARECPCPHVAFDYDDYTTMKDLESRTTATCSALQNSEAPACKVQRITSSVVRNAIVRPFEDTSHFRDSWIQQIQRHQGPFVASTLLNDENKVWLEYVFNEQSPQNSKFRCRICVSFLRKQSNSKSKTLPLLSTEEGFFVKDYSRVYKQISGHSKCALHGKATKNMEKEYVDSLTKNLQEAKSVLESKVAAPHKATVLMIRTVYASVLLNIPFYLHPDIVLLQRLNGAEMGSHHYDPSSATTITESISQRMHENLLKYLKRLKFPFTIIADSSTDATNKNFLLLYFRSIENEFPMTYFYRCLHITEETSDALLRVVTSALQEDNLLQHFHQHARGFSSDGAPTMIGRRGGLSKLLNDSTHHNLYTIHCLAHRLQLVIGHAFMDMDGFKNKFETVINGIYSFYYDKSFKRKESLQKTAEGLGSKFYELHYIYTVRWISSELLALESIYKLYPSLLENMLLISGSPQFLADVKSRAKGYHDILSNSRFFTTFMLTMDILSVLRRYSKTFQLSQGSVIGMEHLRRTLFEEVQKLKVTAGPHVQTLLRDAQCYKAAIWSNCNAQDLDTENFRFSINNQAISFAAQSIRLSSSSRWPALSAIRVQLIDAIINQLGTYFPDGSMELFEILNPLNLPSTAENVATYATGIAQLSLRFEEDVPTAIRQFATVLTSMMTHTSNMYCKLKSAGDAVKFWSYYLDSTVVGMEGTIRRLIYIVLSLPLGSADIERGFSVMHYFKTNRRSRLTAKHMEDIARIKINGVSSRILTPRCIPFTG
jgi:hypothetical protein